MTSTMARAALLSASLCIQQAAMAQEALHFWAASGEHGISACVFMASPGGAQSDHIEQLVFGVSADPRKPQLMGKVRLREAGMPSGVRLLEIGAGPQALLSVALEVKDGDTAIADVPGAAMAEVLRALASRPRVWMRIGGVDGGRGQQLTLAVAGSQDEVSSCVSILDRDLAGYRDTDPANKIRQLYMPVLFPW